MNLRIPSVLSACILGLALPAQTVWKVDPTGAGGAFTHPQLAINAASAGDTILIAPASYAGPTLVDRAVALIADGGTAQLDGNFAVVNVPAGGSVLLQGLTITTSNVNGPALALQRCGAPVWVQDCNFTGLEVGVLPINLEAVLVEDCPAVTFVRCGATGGLATTLAHNGGPGLIVHRSQVYLFESVLTGGTGVDGFVGTDGGAGGPGALLTQDGFLYAQSSVLQGGAGGAGTLPVGCVTGGSGGAGVAVLNGGTFQAVDATLAGGTGGASTPGCTPGATGQPQVVVGGSFSILPGSGFTVTAPAIAREGEAVNYQVQGAPGDLVWLLWSLDTNPVFLPIAKGPFTGAAPRFAIGLGALSPAGQLDLPTVVPDFGPGFTAVRIYWQAVGVNTTTGVVAGSGTALTLLDGSL